MKQMYSFLLVLYFHLGKNEKKKKEKEGNKIYLATRILQFTFQ